MQSSFSEQELSCSECDNKFQSAALLLQHFAMHATESVVSKNDTTKSKPKKPNIPDLYPINKMENHKRSNNDGINDLPTKDDDKEENGDSGIEDLFNPLKYCLVTLDDQVSVNNDINNKSRNNIRKYECQYCYRNFGWSTDLKRHILTHTGEKPFHCHICNSKFTRNFLLQKHQSKQHPGIFCKKVKIPQLKPIGSVIKQKSRKQEKCNIKRKFKTKQLYQSEIESYL